MEPIPKPQLLDSRRLLLTCGDASPAARRAIEDACEYAHQLWDELYRIRQYLLDSTAGGQARPGSPRDDEGWQRWTAVYRDVTRTLTGPRGDGGYALHEAQLAAAGRRDATSPGAVAERGE